MPGCTLAGPAPAASDDAALPGDEVGASVWHLPGHALSVSPRIMPVDPQFRPCGYPLVPGQPTASRVPSLNPRDRPGPQPGLVRATADVGSVFSE